jgi:hypothetical protein
VKTGKYRQSYADTSAIKPDFYYWFDYKFA